MRPTTFLIAFSILPMLPMAAYAQIGNPGFMAPNTQFDSAGMPTANQTNTADILFAQLATGGGMAEVYFSQLAQDRAQATAVGEFAQTMIDDHSSANENLAAIAENNDVPLPEELNPAQSVMYAQLEELEGAAFDLSYMRGQVVDHQKTSQLLMWEIASGQNAELQQFAAETLPTILAHLKLAQDIVADLAQDQLTTNATTD